MVNNHWLVVGTMEWMMEFYDFRFFLLEFHNTDEVHDFSEGLVYHQPDNILVVGGITLDRFFLKHRCLVISFLFIPVYDHDPKMTSMFFWFMISKKGIPMLNWYILVEVLRLLTCGANNLRNEKLMDKDFASLVMQLDLSWESTHLGADKVRKNVHYRNPEKR